MNVAVTGARGFIGRNLTDHLQQQGHTVVRLGRSPEGQQVRLDDDGESVSLFEGVDAVVHLAGRTVDSLETPLAAYVEPNVVLTERLLNMAAVAGATRFVFASSRMVYPSTLGRPAREEDANPDTFYGLSKHVAERLVALHTDRSGTTGTSLRLAQVVGPGDMGRGVLPRLVEQAHQGGPLTVEGAGMAVRDFIHVQDVVRAISIALTNSTGGVYNLGLGGLTIRELAETVASASELGSGAVQEVPFERDDRSVYSLECNRTARHLGWQPSVDIATMVGLLLEDHRS